jgi:hypothetical protein
MIKFWPTGLFFLSAWLLLIWTAPALPAQQQLPNRVQGVEQPPVSDVQLRSFAKAYVEFEKIRAQYEPRLDAAPTPAEKQSVQDEAVALFSKALEKEGLSMQQYSVLFHTVNADDALREKVLRLIEEERAKS